MKIRGLNTCSRWPATPGAHWQSVREKNLVSGQRQISEKEIQEGDGGYALKATGEDYYFTGKNSTLSPENTYLWDDIV